MNKLLMGLGQTGRAIVFSTVAMFLAAGIAQAATTISTNISTGGTLSVTDQTALGQASSTMLSANRAYFGATATSTFSTAGALNLVAALTGTTGSFSSTLAATGATTLSSTLAVTASTTIGTATLFAGPNMGTVGIGTTSPSTILHVENQTATTTVFISTGASAKGGRIILQDVTGATCTEVTSAAGALTAKAVTCPSY